MCADFNAGGADMYAAVDMSKKKNKNVFNLDKEPVQIVTSDALYSVVNKTKKPTKQRDNDTFISEEKINTFSSTDVTKNQEKCFEKNSANTNRGSNVQKKDCKTLMLANKSAIAILITFIIMIGIIIILFIIVFVKVEALESSQMLISHCILMSRNTTEDDIFCDEFEQKLRNIFQQVSSNISSLPNNESDINECLLGTNISSCAELLIFDPCSSSGYYTFRSSTGQLVSVYCDMNRTCGNITGGWMRVAQLDVYNCPSGLMSKLVNGTKTCIKMEAAAGCTPILFSSFNISYSKVCGQIQGYGLGTLDGLINVQGHYRGSSVMDNYLDGISFTVNGSHVWSLVAGRCDKCNPNHNFIHNDFTCTNVSCAAGNVCPELLWDSNYCGRRTPFFKNLSVSTTADLMMKVCRDEERTNEDIAISSIELYVQ